MPPTRRPLPPGLTAAPTVRAGFALVELLVALTVLAAGVLALAGASGRLLAATNAAALVARAAELLEARVEALHGMPCVADAGEREVGPLRERWSAVRDGELLTLRDTVTYTLPRRATRAVGVEATRWCGR